MQIDFVHILNLVHPGHVWWEHVKKHGSEPLIEATITFKLSYAEYHDLLEQDKAARGITDRESTLISHDQSQN